MGSLKVDLHPVYNNSKKIEELLTNSIQEAVDKKIKCIEIIPGKGSGSLKIKVLKFLEQKKFKSIYHRIEKDSKNWGRLWVHFKH